MGTIPYVPSYLRASPALIWPVTSVLDFGAIGNGSTDDYPAITAALHALNARGGGTLVFPNDRDFRIATPGVHGIHLAGQSNITIAMGERSRLIMDNMVDGLAVSHGIFVEGPCENIALVGVHAMFATLSAHRQNWAPIYFLGANVGNGDAEARPYGWYRGNPDGSEAWQQIEAGAVRNVRLENVTSENSPSVGIGLVGVDGIVGSNITVRDTWADGLYHVYFRNARIDGYHGVNVGDDALSTASYESDIEACDIELPFHGEGSIFSNIVLEGRTGTAPSGSIVPLGVRDVVFSDIVVRDRYRAIKLEPGTQFTLDYPTLSLNFLANRRVVISNVAVSGGTQDISLYAKECNHGTPDKWWRHDMVIANVVGENGSSAFDFASTGVPQNGGPPLPIFGGITFRNLKFTNYASPYTTFAGFIDCTVDGLETDSFLSVQGFVPYGSDPDLLDGDGNRMWPESNSTFRSIQCQNITFQGLKRCLIDNVESVSSPGRGIAFSTCADIMMRNLRVVRPNRVNNALDNAAVYADEYCKRLSGVGIDVEQDDNTVHALVVLNKENHWFDGVRVSTTQGPDTAFVASVSDRAWIEDGLSQVRRVDWHHAGRASPSGTRIFPLAPVNVGDSDTAVFAPEGRRYRLAFPLAGDRTWTLHEDEAAIGDRIEVQRDPAATGPYTITFEGQAASVLPFPVSDASTVAVVAGGPGGQITSLEVAATSELLGAPVPWTSTDQDTATALAAAINAHAGTSGFTASSYRQRVTITAPSGSGVAYNNAPVEAVVSGDMQLSVGVIPRMTGGSDSGSAGESAATTSFVLLGDDPDGFAGSIASITVDGTELLGAPVTWQQNSNVFAGLVAEAVMAGTGTHGFTCYAGRNTVFLRAPPGNGASANGWAVVVTPTGDVTTYDVHPMNGGADPAAATPAGSPYPIVTSIPEQPFNAVFEFTATGWALIALVYERLAYPNGVPLIDGDGRLYGQGGAVIADEFDQLKYADGSVLAYTDTLGFGSGPAPASTDPGVPRMARADANFIYVCTAPDTWKRVALATY